MLRPRQNGNHFAADIFKCIFLVENRMFNQIPPTFIPFGIESSLVQVVAWRRCGAKPLPEAMMIRKTIRFLFAWFMVLGSWQRRNNTVNGYILWLQIIQTSVHDIKSNTQVCIEISIKSYTSHIYYVIHTENKTLSIWQLCRDWWHRKLSLRQLTVPPVTTKLSNWRSFVFSAQGSWIITVDGNGYLPAVLLILSELQDWGKRWKPYASIYQVNKTSESARFRFEEWLDQPFG